MTPLNFNNLKNNDNETKSPLYFVYVIAALIVTLIIVYAIVFVILFLPYSLSYSSTTKEPYFSYIASMSYVIYKQQGALYGVATLLALSGIKPLNRFKYINVFRIITVIGGLFAHAYLISLSEYPHLIIGFPYYIFVFFISVLSVLAYNKSI